VVFVALCDLPDVSLPHGDWNGGNCRPNHRLEKAPPDQTFSYPSCRKRAIAAVQKKYGATPRTPLATAHTG
jgi:hypothetical protein